MDFASGYLLYVSQVHWAFQKTICYVPKHCLLSFCSRFLSRVQQAERPAPMFPFAYWWIWMPFPTLSIYRWLIQQTLRILPTPLSKTVSHYLLSPILFSTDGKSWPWTQKWKLVPTEDGNTFFFLLQAFLSGNRLTKVVNSQAPLPRSHSDGVLCVTLDNESSFCDPSFSLHNKNNIGPLSCYEE